MSRPRSGERKQEILETLAQMLEQAQGEHITTAALAKAVGVSEAALYRHFPSKGKMFEALIIFIEESLFTRINVILEEEDHAEKRTYQIINLVLGFTEKNPGITRLIQGDVLVGETKRLRERVSQIFERIETQLKQILREGELADQLIIPSTDAARLFLMLTEGRIARFVRQGFRESPLTGWPENWHTLRKAIFKS